MTPQQSCEASKVKWHLLLMLIPDVFSDYFWCHFISCWSHKVTIIPKFPSPQLLFYLGELLKNYLCWDAFHDLDNPWWCIARRRTEKHMNMIFHYFHSIYLKLISLSNLLEDLFKSCCYLSRKDCFAIFGNPNYVVFEIIDSMSRFFYRAHTQYLYHTFSPSAMLFSSPQQSCGVFNSNFL